MFKGFLHININGQEIHLEKIPGGISLPSMAVPAIRNVSIEGTSLITVENLTTYHDEPVCQNAIVYLGGFHNDIRNGFGDTHGIRILSLGKAAERFGSKDAAYSPACSLPEYSHIHGA